MPDRSKLPIHRVDSLIDILNEKLAYKNLSNNTDFNNINETGFFKFTISDGSVNLNQPIMNQDNKTYNVFCSIYDVNKTIGIQIVYSREQLSFPIYCRIKENNNWLSWYQIAGGGLDMPSNKQLNLGNMVVGTQYTAPANGFIKYQIRASKANEFINIFYSDTENPIIMEQRSVAAQQLLTLFIPVSRGQKYHFDSSVADSQKTTENFMFIYTNSEVPMNER